MTIKIPKAPDYALESARIPARAYLISVWFMYGLVVVAVLGRYAIQYHQRKSPGLDDFFLLIALTCLTASITMLQIQCFDALYLIYAVTHNLMTPPAEMLEIGYQSHIWTFAALMVGWVGICAVKLSFLFFFKKLISRIRSLLIYWWIILLFTLAVCGYVMASIYLVCPWFSLEGGIICASEGHMKTFFRYSLSSIILDIASDVLILTIPIIIVHRIKVSITQKFVLGLSLSLTVLCIIVTILRALGVTDEGQLDPVWEAYWHVMEQLVGVLMAAIISFRTFFIVWSKTRANNNISPQAEARRFYKESILRRMNLRRKGQYSLDDSMDTQTNENGLPSIARPQISGINTFIRGQGRSYRSTIGTPFGNKVGSIIDSTVSKNEEDMIALNPYPPAKVQDRV